MYLQLKKKKKNWPDFLDPTSCLPWVHSVPHRQTEYLEIWKTWCGQHRVDFSACVCPTKSICGGNASSQWTNRLKMSPACGHVPCWQWKAPLGVEEGVPLSSGPRSKAVSRLGNPREQPVLSLPSAEAPHSCTQWDFPLGDESVSGL